MFDAASLNELEEMLGYERYALKKCVDMNHEMMSGESPLVLTIEDDDTRVQRIEFEDSLSEGVARMATEELSPLLFSAGFKLLDMVIEWTIKENTGRRLWTFSDKRRELANVSLIFPDFLGAEPALRERFIGFYEELAKYRNALTHGKWGQNHQGDLHFDFEKDGHRFAKLISFHQVIRFGEVLSDMANAVLNPGTFSARAARVIAAKLNALDNLHGKGTMNVNLPRLCNVIRRTKTTKPVRVNMVRIRELVSKDTGGAPFEIDLRVEAQTPEGAMAWQIPAQFVPEQDFALDDTWQDYEVELLT